MNNLLLTNQQLEFLKLLLLTYEYSDNEKTMVDELEFLTVILDEYEYSDDNFDLYNKLEYKVYKTRPQSYQDKLTTIGG